MEIMNKVDKVKGKLNDLMKKHKFKKANKERQREAGLTLDMVNCAGDLGVCKKEYEWIIRDQANVIRKGMADGYDVFVQKNQLLDAAVGYMLVNEALYVLQSVASYDGVVHAYELLDAATKKITGEKAFPFGGHSKKKPVRSEYEFINSAKTVQEKRDMAVEFLDDLIQTGNIEKCIADTRAKRNSQSRLIMNSPRLSPDMNSDMPASGISLSDDELKMLQEMRNATRIDSASPHDAEAFRPHDSDDNT